MPCVYDVPDPSARQAESHRVAKLIVNLFERMNFAYSKEIKKAAYSVYGNDRMVDEWTNLLCETCSNMTKEQSDKFIYNGRSPDARALADWWDEHQEMDRQRIEAGILSKKQRDEFDATWVKLSPKERRIIQTYFESKQK